jgi:hypothetical protein
MSFSLSSQVCSFSKEAFREHDLDYLRYGFETCPVALKLARQRHPAHGLSSGKSDTFQSGAMRFDRRASDRVDDGVHLEAFA